MPESVLEANWAESSGVLWEPLKVFLSWSESSMGSSYSCLKWNCLPIPWTSLITAIFNILQWLIHHAQPLYKGTDKAFPDWHPCKPTTSWRSNGSLPPPRAITTGGVEVWWNIRVTPVLPGHLQWDPQWLLLGLWVKAPENTALTQSYVAFGLDRQMRSRECIWIHFQTGVRLWDPSPRSLPYPRSPEWVRTCHGRLCWCQLGEQGFTVPEGLSVPTESGVISSAAICPWDAAKLSSNFILRWFDWHIQSRLSIPTVFPLSTNMY